jgi:hypothetical protein
LVLFCSWTCITTGFAEDGTPIITLTGGLIDQATLNGVFARFQDICILLINIFLKNIVNQVEMDLQNDSHTSAEGRVHISRHQPNQT